MTNWFKKEITFHNAGINFLLLAFGFLGTQVSVKAMTAISFFFVIADYAAYKAKIYTGEEV